MGEQVAEYTRHDREAIMALAVRGELTAFVNGATAALVESPDDVELRLILVHRLVDLGLLYAARRVAEDFPPSLRSSPDFSGLMGLLQSGRNNGSASWSIGTPRFEANLEVLRRRYDWGGQLVAAWQDALPRLELHQTRQGYWVVFEHDDRGGGRWRPALGDHRPRESADQIKREVANQIPPPIVLNGIGMGDHLSLIHEATRNTFLGSAPAILQIETDLIGLAAAMHLHDWRDLLIDPRVQIFAGENAYELFDGACHEDPWLHVKPMVIYAVGWDGASRARMETALNRFNHRVDQRRLDLSSNLSRHYQKRDARYWANRFVSAGTGQTEPLRILGITSRFTSVLQYSMRDALRSLEALGCRTSIVIEPEGHSRLSAIPKLLAVERFKPDLVICIDHLRNGSPGSMIENVPFLTWIQDRLPWLFTPAAGESIGPLDFCMGFCRRELIDQHGYPDDRFMACEMATHPASLFAEGSNSPSDAASSKTPKTHTHLDAETGTSSTSKWECDVAYATNFVRTVDQIHGQIRQEADATAQRLIDAIYEELIARASRLELNAGLDINYFISIMQRSVGVEIGAESVELLAKRLVLPIIDQLLRIQTIEWAACWADKTGARFNLYGRGWEDHARYGRFSRGFVEHGPELGEAFRHAKVNLHAGSNMAFHQRVLDGLGAGGFFLIRDHANDRWFEFQPALHRLIQERRLGPGDEICGDDLPPELRAAWGEHRRKTGKPADMAYLLTEEHLEAIRAAVENSDSLLPSKIWPELHEVVFDSPRTLDKRLTYYVEYEAQRNEIAKSMREKMLKSLSYKALMERMLNWLTAAIRHQCVRLNCV